jgi:hypothetical protein
MIRGIEGRRPELVGGGLIRSALASGFILLILLWTRFRRLRLAFLRPFSGQSNCDIYARSGFRPENRPGQSRHIPDRAVKWRRGQACHRGQAQQSLQSSRFDGATASRRALGSKSLFASKLNGEH